MTIRAIQITRSPMCVCIDLQQLVSGADPTHRSARCNAHFTSEMGHSRPMHSVRVPINVRCYSNSAIIIRRSAVTLRARKRHITAANSAYNRDLSRAGGQRASGASAWRSGSLDICNSPAKGRSISRIRKIAPDTESAPTKKVTITIGLG